MSYNNNRSNTRTVSYTGSGGLNERFSKISQAATSRTTTTITRPAGPTTVPAPTNTSVFSRLRGAKPVNKSIQNRLGKTIGGGIKKANTARKNGPTSMTGIVKGSGQRTGKRVVVAAKGGHKKQVVGKKAQSTVNKKQQQIKKKKPATAEELDKALDNYMMKDPKTAQAKLDADMNAYMAEMEDISMEDTL